MIIPDANLLLYAYDSSCGPHARAAAWWQRCVNGSEPVGLPRVVLFGFLRLATNPRVYARPMTVSEAAGHIASWTALPHVVELEGGPDHVRTVAELVGRAGTGGNLVTDAQIAALAMEHRATLFTNDSDFRRFPGLRSVNPLAASS